MSLTNRTMPKTRMRRMRKNNFSRNLMRENNLSVNDLIYPVFVVEGKNKNEKIDYMPGITRQSIDQLLYTAEKIQNYKIPMIALFPANIINKSLNAQEAYNPKGLIPQTIKTIKKNFPDLGVMTDIALDPYTIHGQDGLIDDNGYILNDETIETLMKQALIHAQSGADVIAPSDMMDGRIGYIRNKLEENHFKNTLIMAYSAKYASTFYEPFRQALGVSKNLKGSNKYSYQMDPANSNEALHEVELDINEGADMVMIKPGIAYLDIVRLVKDKFKIPTYSYQVSGEYSMLKGAINNGWLNKLAIYECLISFKRAGSDGILTYFALEIAEFLKNQNVF